MVDLFRAVIFRTMIVLLPFPHSGSSHSTIGSSSPQGVSISEPSDQRGGGGCCGGDPLGYGEPAVGSVICHESLAPIVSVAFWSRDAEASASSDASASCYRRLERCQDSSGC